MTRKMYKDKKEEKRNAEKKSHTKQTEEKRER